MTPFAALGSMAFSSSAFSHTCGHTLVHTHRSTCAPVRKPLLRKVQSHITTVSTSQTFLHWQGKYPVQGLQCNAVVTAPGRASEVNLDTGSSGVFTDLCSRHSTSLLALMLTPWLQLTRRYSTTKHSQVLHGSVCSSWRYAEHRPAS